MIEGKIEAGILEKSKNYLMMPNREQISIAALYGEQEEELKTSSAHKLFRFPLLPGRVFQLLVASEALRILSSYCLQCEDPQKVH